MAFDLELISPWSSHNYFSQQSLPLVFAIIVFVLFVFQSKPPEVSFQFLLDIMVEKTVEEREENALQIISKFHNYRLLQIQLIGRLC